MRNILVRATFKSQSYASVSLLLALQNGLAKSSVWFSTDILHKLIIIRC